MSRAISSFEFNNDFLHSLKDKNITVPQYVTSIQIKAEPDSAVEIIYTTKPDREVLEAIMGYIISKRLEGK